MKKLIVSFLFTISLFTVYAADNDFLLSVLLIPDSLKQDALAVIRENNAVFEYETLQKGTFTEKEVITVLNEKGKKYAHFNYPGDKYRTLADFSGKIYDAMGNLVGKVKKSDVQSSQWSEYLGSDELNYYYFCEPPSYPFTVVYEYSISFKNGILTFPPFIPQGNSDVSVQNSSYKLIVPQNTKILCKEINIATFEKNTTKNSDNYVWHFNNKKAIEDEPFMPNFEVFLPLVFARPQSFLYDDVPGEITDWNSLGKWEWQLLQGRQTLSEATVSKIKELTATVTTDKEKVKILYDYLGKTTHYQNISLGIGGFQPMTASEVCKIGFGDCKGLTNYLRSMLQAIDIKSNYTIIKASEDSKNIFEDYANFNQFNHIILQVPLTNETMWLECTNPEVPFGFIHNSIAGHQALVVDETGGKLIRLPDYPDSINLDKNLAEITVFSDGKAQGKTTNIFSVKKYDDYRYFVKLKNSEQVDKVRSYLHVPSANITSFSLTEDKSPLPSMAVKFEWETPQYGNKTGTRLFIPANPLRKSATKPNKNKRKSDIEFIDGSIDVDTIIINIPDNYEVEGLSAPINFTCVFGSFSSNISVNGTKITVTQIYKKNQGYWKADKYKEILDLYDKVNSGYSSKIILKSKL